MTAILPKNFEWYREQIAGHHPSVVKNGEHQIGFVKELGSEMLLKPLQEGIRGECEANMYEKLFSLPSLSVDPSIDNMILREFVSFVPRYYGRRQLRIGQKDVTFLIIEDLTQGYRRPCTMDIKMGMVTSDPNASEEKRKSEAAKYAEQQILGFRLLGYRVHCNNSECELRIRDKQWGRTRTLENIADAYYDFLSERGDSAAIVANSVYNQLLRIQDWFHRQTIYHFYASSILIVYEASQSLQPSARVKLIDFSHVFAADGRLDDNYIVGLDNVVSLVKQCRDRMLSPKIVDQL